MPLLSRASVPEQRDLDRALAGARRLRVADVISGTELARFGDPQEVASFAATLRIRPGDLFHCMCAGDQSLEFSRPWRRRVAVTLHHGRSIRWEGRWNTDALLDDPGPMLDWLAAHGVPGPRDEHDHMAEQQKRSREVWAAWCAAAPACLATLVGPLSEFGGPPENLEAARREAAEALQRTYPDERDAIRALLEWFARGEGAWSSFPSYEQVPERLLLEFPTERIVAALEQREPAPDDFEGAARLLASWWFGQERPGDAASIPEALAARLLAHVEASGDDDKRTRLHACLGR